jgi:hypothetical protein
MKFQQEVIQGEVICLDVENRCLNLRRTNPVTGKQEEIEVYVPINAELKGISSLWHLDYSDVVQVDVLRSDISHILEAYLLEVA